MSKKVPGNDHKLEDWVYHVPLCKFDNVIDIDDKSITNENKVQECRLKWDHNFNKMKKERDQKMKTVKTEKSNNKN